MILYNIYYWLVISFDQPREIMNWGRCTSKFYQICAPDSKPLTNLSANHSELTRCSCWHPILRNTLFLPVSYHVSYRHSEVIQKSRWIRWSFFSNFSRRYCALGSSLFADLDLPVAARVPQRQGPGAAEWSMPISGNNGTEPWWQRIQKMMKITKISKIRWRCNHYARWCNAFKVFALGHHLVPDASFQATHLCKRKHSRVLSGLEDSCPRVSIRCMEAWDDSKRALF